MTASTPLAPRRRTATVLLLLVGLLAALFIGSEAANAAPATRHHVAKQHVVTHHAKKHHKKKHHAKKHHRVVHKAAPVTKVPAPPARTTGTTTPTVPARTATEASIGAAVLSQLNSERAANHLPALTTNAQLLTSARRHDLAMAAANDMSHQVSGEAPLATRVTDAGYHWSWAGENIGWNSQMTSAGVLQLQTMMYNEVAPDDGHRLNILNSHYTNVGVDVYLDNIHHKVWLTTDFGRP